MSPQVVAGAFGTLFFLFVAAVLFLRLPRSVRFLALVPALCAVPVAAWTVYNVVATFRGGNVARLMEADPARVRAVRLEPPRAPGPPSLVASDLRITDPATIAKVCAALRASTPYMPNHPQGVWSVVLGLEDPDGIVYAVIEQTTNQGVLVDVFSNRTTGWVLGQRRDDALGPVIQGIVGAKPSP